MAPGTSKTGSRRLKWAPEASRPRGQVVPGRRQQAGSSSGTLDSGEYPEFPQDFNPRFRYPVSNVHGPRAGPRSPACDREVGR